MPESAPPAEWLVRANRLSTVAALLSTTIHEVNNALQVISGSAQMLTPEAASTVVERRAEAIAAQAWRASALMAELSSFARADTPDPSSVDLANLGRRALTLRQYTLAKFSIQSSFESAAAVPPASCSSRAALQIVLNLLLNAEQVLAGRENARIRVTTAGRDKCVELTVDDNGPGLAARDLRRLFEPTIDAASNRLGIGLAVSRWLAERAGGTLTCAPSDLGGAAFTLSLKRSG